MPAFSELRSDSAQVLALRQREAEVRRIQDRDVDSHLKEVKDARAGIDQALKAFQEKVGSAQKSVRKTLSEDSVKYQTYLTSQARMAGAIHQSLKQAYLALQTAELRRQEEQNIAPQMNAVADSLATLKKALQDFEGKVLVAQRVCEFAASEDSARLCLTVQSRTAGAVAQAIERAGSMERVVESVKVDRRERAQVEDRERAEMAVRTAVQDVQKLLLPDSDQDDMDLLYSDNEVTHA